jgi:hypothetical protein
VTAGCSGRRTAPAGPTPADELEAALDTGRAAEALRRLPSARFQGTWSFRVSAPQAPADAGAAEAVATTTELRLDRHGHYRILETNDRDGGREIVLHDRELALSLRYGKLVRRPAQEPEVTRYLEEAIGGPWAAWELVGRFAQVERQGPGVPAAEGVAHYRITKATSPRPGPASLGDAGAPLRGWREGLAVDELEGEAKIDRRTGVLVAFALDARFGAARGRTPIAGALAVRATVDEIGANVAIAPPMSEDLRPRQRTVLEERALLGRTPAGGAPSGGTGASAPKRSK